MAEEQKSQSWWQTLPGIFTALAGIVTAVTGLVVTLNQAGLLGKGSPPKSETQKVAPAPQPTPPVAPKTSSEGGQTAALPFFMTRPANKADLAGKSNWELDVMRNEIYARHGRRFNRADLQRYFDAQPWYRPQFAPEVFPESMLTDVQRANVQFIAAYQRGREGR